MLDKKQLRDLIKEVCEVMQVYSKNAEELIVFTIVNESEGGTYVRQIEGPALGICQMEPATYDDHWNVFLPNRPEIVFNLLGYLELSTKPSAKILVHNLLLSIAMCRIHYLRVPDPLPHFEDIPAMAEYYKNHYNTRLGKADVKSSIAKYERYIGKKRNK